MMQNHTDDQHNVNSVDGNDDDDEVFISSRPAGKINNPSGIPYALPHPPPTPSRG